MLKVTHAHLQAGVRPPFPLPRGSACCTGIGINSNRMSPQINKPSPPVAAFQNSNEAMTDFRAQPAHSSPAPSSEVHLVIHRGTCRVLFVYDVGAAIDLAVAEQSIDAITQRERIRRTRRAPLHFEYETPPVRVPRSMVSIAIGGFSTDEELQVILYEFGAIAVSYTLQIPGPLESLLPLADRLYENAALLADSRRRTQEVVELIHSAIRKPHLANLVEDYVLYEVNELSGAASPAELRERAGTLLAQILRAETRPLSQQEINDALATEVSYGRNDAVWIDWNAAFLMDTDPDNVLAVLEFANVELLELRFLDDRLDDALEQSERLTARRRVPAWLPAPTARAMNRIAEFQMESVLLFEDVNNTLKLLGDQYLARVYRAAAQRLHLPDWDAIILRKLQTLESIYQRTADQQMQLRMELLEWIIIVLIAISIVLPFLPWVVGGK